jgi:hypothetical protein
VTSKKDQEQYWAQKEIPYTFVAANEFADAFQSFHIGQKLGEELSIPFDKAKAHPAALTINKYGVGKKKLLKACISRELLLMKRNSFFYIFKMIQVSSRQTCLTFLFNCRKFKLDKNVTKFNKMLLLV